MNLLSTVGYGAAAGTVATLLMDLSNLIWTPLGVRGIEPAMFGKWLDALRAGRIVSEDLSAAPPSTVPMWLGLLVHYAIGMTLGTGFIYVLGLPSLSTHRPWAIGIAYGLATCVFAWFFMFPSMGFGVFGRHPPDGVMLFTGSVLRHAAYGIGLGLVAQLWIAERVAAA